MKIFTNLLAVAFSCCILNAASKNQLDACIMALGKLTNYSVAVANSASSSFSQNAFLADKISFGVDIGNYDFCTQQDSLHHCLAGSVTRDNKFLLLPPQAGEMFLN